MKSPDRAFGITPDKVAAYLLSAFVAEIDRATRILNLREAVKKAELYADKTMKHGLMMSVPSIYGFVPSIYGF